ncbi:DUF5776 domain-containing protein [Apilactobacillus timberlakei]|uniref:DUF5776 domain-containing protein n=1 Tax=Apilactobacillus timberlakei TaxID=2008380 RepID=UPI00112EAE31|nr:DUF5776 domain-containing protein [Apilactobacillus timberlakei]TPR19323.1 hypothetical protein DYZ95_01515 [Apilactobacillus timberlakei]
MPYNKNKFLKSKDKKIMRKVKKEWVVISFATLSFLGAASIYGLSMNDISAHASASGNSSVVKQQVDSSPGNGNDPDSQYTATVNNASESINTNSKAADSNSSTTSSVAHNDFSGAGNQANIDNSVASSGVQNIASQSSTVNNYSKLASAQSRNNNSQESSSAAFAQSNASSAYVDTSNAANDAITQKNGYNMAKSASSQNNQASINASNAANSYAKLSDAYLAASSANSMNDSLGSVGRYSEYNSITSYYNIISGDYGNASSAQTVIDGNSDASGNSVMASNANNYIQNAWNNINSSNSYGSSFGSSTSNSNNITNKSSFDSSEYVNETSYENILTSASTSISSASNSISLTISADNLAEAGLKSILTSDIYQRELGTNDAWSQIQSNQPPTLNSGINNTNSYINSFNGVVDAWNKYNSMNMGVGTQSVPNYINYKNVSNPNDPNSVDPYLNSGDSSINRENLTQIKKAEIPSDPSSSHETHNESENIVSQSTDADYNAGITYFLLHQGYHDAESGKWNGTAKNQSYTPNPSSDNAYDQAYMGAQEAISKQWNSDNTLNYDIQNGQRFTPTASSNNANFKSGFDDVVSQVNQGTAFISNAIQFNNAIYTGNQVSGDSNQYASLDRNEYYYQHINNVKFVQDINFQNTTFGTSSGSTEYDNYLDPYYNSYGTLTYDGQNHAADFGDALYSMDDNGLLNIKNFSALYGTNFYGPFKLESYGTLNYSNVTYVGSQLMMSNDVDVNVYNNLNVFSVGRYMNPWGQLATTEAWNYLSDNNINGGYGDDQQNFQINNFTLKSNSNYYGSTTGGNVVEADGNFTIDSNAHMKLAPMGAHFGAEDSVGTAAVGLYLKSSGNVLINPGAQVDIVPQSDGSFGNGQGLYIDNGSLTIDNGSLNIIDNGSPYNNYANTIDGTVNVKNGGSFNIYGSNLSDYYNYSGYLLYVEETLNITNRGNLYIHTDGSGGNLTLLYNSGALNISNPGKHVTLQIDNGSANNTNKGNGNLFYGNTINAYSVKYSLGYDSEGRINNPSPDMPYYQVTVPTSGNIQYYDLGKGQLVTSNYVIDNSKYLSFNSTPNAFFDGQSMIKQNSSGQYEVVGKVELSNLPSNDTDNPNRLEKDANGKVYMEVQSDGFAPGIVTQEIQLLDNNGNFVENLPYSTDTSDPELAQLVDDRIKNDRAFTCAIPIPLRDNNGNALQNGYEIKFIYHLPAKPTDNVSVQTHYFVTDPEQVIYSNGTVNTYLRNPLDPSQYVDTVNTPNNVFIQTPIISVASGIGDGTIDGINASKIINSDKNPGNGYEQTNNWINSYAKATIDDRNAYKNAYIDAYKGYKQAEIDYEINNYSPINYSINSYSYKVGYQAYDNDLKNGFNDKINNYEINDKSNYTAYNRGIDEATGIIDITSGKFNKLNDNFSYQLGSTNFNNSFDCEINNQQNMDPNQNSYSPSYHYGIVMANGLMDGQNNQNNSDLIDPVDRIDYNNGQLISNAINDGINGQFRTSLQNNENYNFAYNAANKGFYNNNDYSAYKYQQNIYNIGFASKKGLIDLLNGISSGSDSYYGNFNQSQKYVYRTAQLAAKAGANGDTNESENFVANLNIPANKVGLVAYQGMNDASKQQNHSSSYYGLKNTSYVNAQNAYYSGLLGKKSDDMNAAKNLLAYNVGLAAKRGINDYNVGIHEDTLHSSPYNNWDSSQQLAYDNAQKAYAAGLINSQNNADALLNSIANRAGQAAYNGSEDALFGNNNSSNYTGDNLVAYDNAQIAYTAGLKGKADTTQDAINNKIAYNIGLAAQQAINDSENNINEVDIPNNDYHNVWNTQQQKAYYNAIKAYRAGSDDNYTAQDQQNAKLNIIANRAGYAEFAGISDASYGNHNNQSYYADNKHEITVYNNAQNDFFDGLQNNGQNSSTTGYDVGQYARQGIEDSNTNTNAASEPNSGYKDWHPIKQAAYKNAQTAYQAGLKNDASSADAQLNQMANTSGLAAYQGATDAAAGNTDNQTKYASDSINSTAYANAQKAYTAGLYVYPNTADAQLNPTAYNVGVAARQEITDSINNVNEVNDPNSDYHKTWTTQQQVAYQNAQKSFQAGMDGDQTEQDKINANLNIPANLLGLASRKAITDSVNGQDNSNAYDKNQADDKEIYQRTQKSYQAGLKNDSTSPTAQFSKPANQAGLAAYQGTTDAAAGNTDNQNKYLQNSDNENAYSNAQKAFNAGLHDQSSDNQDAKKNPTAYNVGKTAKQGIDDSIAQVDQAKNLTSPYHKWAPQQQVAYQNAQKAYQAGYDNDSTSQDQQNAKLNPTANNIGQAVRSATNDVSNVTNDPAKYPANSDIQKAYNKTQQAYQDAVNGKPYNPSEPVVAYNIGKAANQAIQDANNNINQINDPKSDYNNKYTNAQQSSYKRAASAYQAGVTGESSNNSASQENPIAYQAGSAANTGITDAINGNSSHASSYNDSLDNQAAYKNAQQIVKKGYHDGSQQIKEPPFINNQSPSYTHMYSNSYNSGSQAAIDGANAFNNGSQLPENQGSLPALARNQGYDDAQKAYNNAIDSGETTVPSNLNPAQKVGYEKGASIISGIIAYTNGQQPTNTNSNFQAGYNTAKQAINGAVTAARSGNIQKNNDGSIVIPRAPAGIDQKTYNDIYQGGYDGYTNGLNGGSDTPNANNPKSKLADYIASYRNSFKTGEKDMPMPEPVILPPEETPKVTAIDDLLNNNGPQTQFATPQSKQEYQAAYSNTEQGLEAALKNIQNSKDNTQYYNEGYAAGVSGKSGINDAKNGVRSIGTDNPYYINGYDGYEAGKNAAEKSIDNPRHDLSNHNIIYSYAYKQAYKQEEKIQKNLGIKQGLANAKKHHQLPKNFVRYHSPEYVRAYMQAYHREERHILPHYIYNMKSIFLHREVKFTRHNRIKYYHKDKYRYKDKIFKVHGLKLSKTGLPRYKVHGGYVTARNNYVANVYYYTNFKRFRISKPRGALVHNDLHFNKKNVVKKLKVGTIIKVHNIVKYNGITRFYVGKGEYVTSNKTYVDKFIN